MAIRELYPLLQLLQAIPRNIFIFFYWKCIIIIRAFRTYILNKVLLGNCGISDIPTVSGTGRGIAIELARLGASLTLADLDVKGLGNPGHLFIFSQESPILIYAEIGWGDRPPNFHNLIGSWINSYPQFIDWVDIV